ncbi:MAG: hypothetical protein QXS66_07590 [Thermoproteota archaeon]
MRERIVAIEKKLEKVSRMEKSRFIDMITAKGEEEILVECKHGYEPETDPTQIKDYFTYAETQTSSSKKIKIRLFIGNEITGPGVKDS